MVVELAFSGMLDKCHKFVVCTKPRSKLKHSNTAAPIELRLVTILLTMVHLFNCGSYFSTEFKLELPSFPPSANRFESISTTSWVDLGNNNNKNYIQASINALIQMWARSFVLPSGMHGLYWFPRVSTDVKAFPLK